MNPRPIETARDADLRSSVHAMQRAAERAWELARRTGTAIVLSHDGIIETIQMPPVPAPSPDVPRPSPRAPQPLLDVPQSSPSAPQTGKRARAEDA